MKAILIYGISIIILISCSPTQPMASAAADIRAAVDSSKWIFTPQQAMPLYGRTRTVNGNFSVACNSKQLMVYLPYFGKATAGADVLSGKGPLDFTANISIMEVLKPKEGEWNITITPANTEVQQMNFNFFNNGAATLNIIMTNRSSISYKGIITAYK